MEALLRERKKKLNKAETIITDKKGIKYRINEEGEKEEISKTSGFVIDTKPDFQVAKVIENILYVGSQDATRNYDELKAKNVTHILSLVEGISQAYPNEFTYKTVPILDIPETTITDYIEECFEFINEARDNNAACLVHCNAGVSRSCSICIAYLMNENKIDYQTAYQIVKDNRPACRPNDGFKATLQDYGEQLLNSNNNNGN
eukprot:TRINITY_DN2081_c1_g1_i2.p1 TRINITY_DN2081_c1_g1~~TRINITY_DN2081_c1_g1_i2.p1  ORF type:complete len:203 (-),score=68.25 TRINITY_DN2081_c1_g1_i2:25-633(-)